MLCQLLLVAAMWVWTADAQSAPSPFRVIVHASNPVSRVSRAELSAIFTKRLRSWPDNSEIIPVDQSARSRTRQRFSRSIHKKSVQFVTRYWQRLIFSGRAVPPEELPSDAAVVAFIEANKGGIGYIEGDVPAGAAVKVIEVIP